MRISSLALALALAACGSHAAPTTSPTPPTPAIPAGPVPDLDPDGDGTFGTGGDGSNTTYDFALETVGPITFKLDPAGLAKALGEPASKTPPAEMAATGEWITTWAYPGQGLEVTLSSTSEHGSYTVGAIAMVAPCALKTSRGVGIGTSLDDIKRAYNTDITEGTVDHVLIGSVYGGLMIDVANGAASRIFIGAGAE